VTVAILEVACSPALWSQAFEGVHCLTSTFVVVAIANPIDEFGTVTKPIVALKAESPLTPTSQTLKPRHNQPTFPLAM
jgi:hypothetical protein